MPRNCENDVMCRDCEKLGALLITKGTSSKVIAFCTVDEYTVNPDFPCECENFVKTTFVCKMQTRTDRPLKLTRKDNVPAMKKEHTEEIEPERMGVKPDVETMDGLFKLIGTVNPVPYRKKTDDEV
jgi:hypothetical protein